MLLISYPETQLTVCHQWMHYFEKYYTITNQVSKKVVHKYFNDAAFEGNNKWQQYLHDTYLTCDS